MFAANIRKEDFTQSHPSLALMTAMNHTHRNRVRCNRTQHSARTTPQHRQRAQVLKMCQLLLIVGSVTTLSGCTVFDSNDLESPESTDHARVYYVGVEPVITFDGESDVRLPVGGCLLSKAQLRVAAEATAPMKEDELDISLVDDWSATVIIRSGYFKRARDNDVVAITVTAGAQDPGTQGGDQPPPTGTGESQRTQSVSPPQEKTSREGRIEGPSTSSQSKDGDGQDAHRIHPPSVTRHFTLRKVDEFRTSVLASMVPYNDLRAFPMSSEVVEEVFGDHIDENYYAIAIRIFNRTPIDKVITSGMITAHGQLVALSPRDLKDPILVMPVQISPVQSTLAYTNVDAMRNYTGRNITFRFLSFVGALATGASEAFAFNDTWRSTVSLFTGIAIPEGQKLWPDPTSEHLANIVTFGMPDTVKVAPGASAGGVLFFAKRELHSMIGQAEFLKFTKTTALNPKHLKQAEVRLEHPPQFIASLEVNSLNVFFENAISPEELERLSQRRELFGGTQQAGAKRSVREARREASELGEDILKQLAKVADVTSKLGGLPITSDPGSPTLETLAPEKYGLHPLGETVKQLAEVGGKITDAVADLTDERTAVLEACKSVEALLGAYEVADAADEARARTSLETALAQLQVAVAKLRAGAVSPLGERIDEGRKALARLDDALPTIQSEVEGLIRHEAGQREAKRLLGSLRASS
jgi:hypothetical protein